MADSGIVVSGLTATGGFGQVELTWTVSNEHEGWPKSLQLDAVELWAAASNDRSLASKVREGEFGAVHTGLARGTTRYYWIKPRNNAGYYGDWHPSGATSGVEGVEAVGSLEVPAVSGLVVTPGAGQNFLVWDVEDESGDGLGYLSLDRVEVFTASSNDRDTATLACEGVDDAIHITGDGDARYYWIRPRHIDGTYGDWFPASSTGGVEAAATADLTLEDGWVELANGLILEWGHSTSDGSGIAVADYQKLNSPHFPWAVTAIVSIDAADTVAYVAQLKDIVIVGSDISHRFEVRSITNGGTVAAATGVTVKWMALGY